MKRLLLCYHPFLFSIYPVLFLYSYNLNEIWSTGELFLLISITLCLTLPLFSLAIIILREAEISALITTFFLFLFYSYGHFIRVIWTVRFSLFNIAIGRNLITFTLWLIIFIYGTIFLLKNRKKLQVYTRFANITGLLLITISLLNIITYSINNRMSPKEIGDTDGYEIGPRENQNDLRDIYYIILDRYARADILKNVYGYDNSEFIYFLKSKGFHVASESNANYPRTSLSLTSSLNMEYINYLCDIVGKDSKNAKPLCDLLSNHKLGNTLKSLGYKYIHLGSYHVLTKYCKIADVNLNKFMIPEFTMTFYKTTMLYPVGEKMDLMGEYMSPRSNILYIFKKLSSISDMQEPVFVFAHIMLPHLPYIFDRNGNPLTYIQRNTKSINEMYVDQLIYTNNKVMGLIDTLLMKSTLKPIIVLQSDEGPFPSWYQEITDRYKEFKYRKVSNEELRQKMSILNAYYLPEIDTGVFSPSITPVNSFRVIFNHFFNAQLPLLPDKNYAIEDEDHPYRMFEVTDRLLKNKNHSDQ